MKAHLSYEFTSALVTGTNDIEAARECALKAVGERLVEDGYDEQDMAEQRAPWLTCLANTPLTGHGRFVPMRPDSDYSVMWYEGSGQPGDRGVTLSVTWPEVVAR